MADCYYLDGARNQQGPVPTEEIARLIRGGTIRRDTMVWYAGMPQWSPAGQVSDFAPLFAQAAPPRPGGPPPVGPPMQRAAPGGGAYQYHAVKEMTFGGAIKTCFGKYATFRGRARRPEFWWWFLFYYLVLIGLSIIDAVITAAGGPGVFALLAILVFFLPTLAAQVRRLHDTDRSGWFILLSFIPLVGIIILIVFWCQRGTDGPNRFGSDDLSVASEFD